MEPEPAVAPPDDGIEGHVPGESHDDDRQQDRACNGEISLTVRSFQALENGSNLQADEDERQDVQREHDSFPYRVRWYACRAGILDGAVRATVAA